MRVAVLDLGTNVKADQIIYHKFESDFNLDDMAKLKVNLYHTIHLNPVY